MARSATCRALQAFAGRNGLAVIEDAAQAHGASWSGAGRVRPGRPGVQLLSEQEPGRASATAARSAPTTPASPRAPGAAQPRPDGQGRARMAGFNERLDTLQARVSGSKLPHLDGWNEQRRRRCGAATRATAGRKRTRERPRSRTTSSTYTRSGSRTVSRSPRLSLSAESGPGSTTTTVTGSRPSPTPGGPASRRPSAGPGTQLSLPMFPGIREAEVARVCEVLAELF